jgi:type III pantothenate kinase
MLLLVDIGNTRIKWARLVNGKMGKQRAAAHAGWGVTEYARRVIGGGWARHAVDGRAPSGRIIVSSVAAEGVNRSVMAAARAVGAPVPEFVASERSAAGITTDYLDPWRLGVDRFVAAIGAHQLASRQSVCVVNVGTAITIDLVDGSGRHRGGAIVPGAALMVSSLLTQTSGIRRRATGGHTGRAGMFAKTTRSAITEGARYAAASVIDRAIEEARLQLASSPLVLLTGGGSADVRPLIRSMSVSLPDLVLHGLAVWARQMPPPQQRTQTSRKRRRLV